MKIISWNVNGIRSVYKKDFQKWLEGTNADFVCLQEVKAQGGEVEAIYPRADLFQSPSYRFCINPAFKKGYSGVIIFFKKEPLVVKNTLGIQRFDEEGRILELEYPDFTLLNLYIPHGGRQKENMNYKLEVYGHLLEYLGKFSGRNVILAGDFNVAHQEVDLARPKENQDNTMFTPEERKQLDRLVELGFIDSFRMFCEENGHYTWWPYANDARERNLGWRIDYVFVSEKLVQELKDAFILFDVTGSDHCPVGIEI